MRGGKYSLFEGGIRANSFISGGLLPAAVRGTVLHGVLHVCRFSIILGVLNKENAEFAPFFCEFC